LNVYAAIKSFVDKIFGTPISFLELAIEKIRTAALISSQGLNINQYLSIFGDLPRAWQMVISSALLATVLLGTLLIFRSLMRMYYSVKEGVKWW